MTDFDSKLRALAVKSDCPPAWLGDQLFGLLRAAADLALEAAEAATEEVEREQRARVEATATIGEIWKDGKTLSLGIWHAGMYMRSAIRALRTRGGSTP